MKKFLKSFAESSTKTQLFTVIATLFFLFYCACNASAETRREGNNFISTSTSAKKDTLVTTYTFQVGTEKYPIIVNRASGRCYVWKKSSKSGKLYKMYVKADIAKTICKELGIQYVEKK